MFSHLKTPDAAAVVVEGPVLGNLSALDVPYKEGPVRVRGYNLHFALANIKQAETSDSREMGLPSVKGKKKKYSATNSTQGNVAFVLEGGSCGLRECHGVLEVRGEYPNRSV